MNHQQQTLEPISAEASWQLMFKNSGISPSSLRTLERKIGHSFVKKELLFEALTHRSALVAFKKFCKAKSLMFPESLSCYERIEFLGDSVLGVVVSWMLWSHKTKNQEPYSEGELSRIKAFLISEKSLAALAKDLELHRVIALSSSEKANSGNKRAALLADCLEALIGALFIDGGYELAETFIRKIYKPSLKKDLQELSHDFKSRLQEIIQGNEKRAPRYEMLESKGPDHAKHFRVGVYTGNKKLACAWGASKKKASQEAAKQALLKFAKKSKTKGKK